MISYILRRLVYAVLTLVALSALVFGVTHLLPGDVTSTILGQFATDYQIAAVRTKLGLNDPLMLQYWHWASGVATGDLGRSMVMDRPIGPVLGEAILRSATLAGLSFVLIAIIGVGLGILAAMRQGQALDHAVSVVTYLGVSVPEFFWAIVVVLLFAGTFHLLPATGYEPMTSGFGIWALHLVAPVVTLVFAHLAHVSRLTRSSMIETLGAAFVLAARAKGVPERRVLLRHALRNALMPTITVLALDFGRLMGGIVVVESVFAYPGLGRTLVYAIQQRDLPMLEAGILVVAAIYVLANLLADLAYAALDPRIRYGGSVA